jgi:Holliday junction resolvase
MDDLEVEDLFNNDEPSKKKINGKKKGNRVELELCKMLTKRFGKEFSRSVGSGNRWSQVKNMPDHAKTALLGDLCPPTGFKWVIECKGGYDDDVDFSSILYEGSSRVNEFIKQSGKDAEQSGRKPLICWKRSRKPWAAILRKEDVDLSLFKYYIHYQEWTVVALEKLLLAYSDDEYWFEANQSTQKE